MGLFNLLSIFSGCMFHLIFMNFTMVTSVTVNVELQSSLYFCDSTFLSITIDSELIKNKFEGFTFGSKKLLTLAQGLSPCYLRLGGTYADFLNFSSNEEEGISSDSHDHPKEPKGLNATSGYLDHLDNDGLVSKSLKNYTMTGKQWDRIINFTSLAGWDVMFDFNLFRWHNGLWDPTNAEKLLKYSAVRDYKLQAFQLGNEPNSFKYNFNISIPAATLVKDFQILKALLTRYPLYANKSLYGPDVTNLNKHASSRGYLQDFVSAGGNQTVKEISLHQYYLNGRIAKAYDFYSVAVLDSLKEEISMGHSLAGGSSIRLTETSSCYGGGAPGLSDRFVAGFLWLDKLGLAAKLGVTKVFRQTFFGGNYALVSRDLHPSPDYFLSLLYKRLIEGPVFNASTEPSTKHLRIYAHCTRYYGQYKSGALTLSFLNIQNTSIPVSFGQFLDQYYHVYILTPGDSAGLESRFVKLNGKILQMLGSSLPPLEPKPHRGVITLPALSFGFIVVPGAQVSLCTKKV